MYNYTSESDHDNDHREHQKVIIGECRWCIPFKEALEQREKLIKLKQEKVEELERIKTSVDEISVAIQNSCHHDWVTEVYHSAGEKDVSHYCKICWKQGYGKAPTSS